MKYLKKLLQLWWLVGLYSVLMLLLVTTDPFRAPLAVVIVPFGLLFLALFATFNVMLGSLGLRQRISRKKRLLISAGAAWLPVMLLILRSIDQLTLRDGLILGVFTLALLLYISRTNFKTQ